ncbi:hypothetical protein [Cryobacterium breve]|uniref:hypothetical protein n=1 Tax=Cryobacterium breve TaxID=1259258 RepID=UPI00248BE7A9|nr:hypothetical protein [Cryobacterium breve]
MRAPPRLRERHRGGPARGTGRFDEPDRLEVDEVDDVGDIRVGDRAERRVDPPVAEEDVPLEEPERGVEPGLFEGGGEGDGGVKARAEPPLEHLGGRAHLLPGRAPARRRHGVADVPGPHRVEDRLDRGIDPLGALGLVPAERGVAGALLQQVARLDEQRRDDGGVRLHVRGEEFEAEVQGVAIHWLDARICTAALVSASRVPAASRRVARIEPGRCSSTASMSAGSSTSSTVRRVVLCPAPRSTMVICGAPSDPAALVTSTSRVAARCSPPRFSITISSTTGTRQCATA